MLECGLLKAHCAHCPIRLAGMARPRSIFARIHRWHSAWWPAWRGLQCDLRVRAQAARSQASPAGAK
jgi:hypothetical protein